MVSRQCVSGSEAPFCFEVFSPDQKQSCVFRLDYVFFSGREATSTFFFNLHSIFVPLFIRKKTRQNRMTTLAVALLLPELFIKVTILYASCAKCIYALLYLCREITLNGLGLIARTLQLTGRLILQLLLGRHSPRQPCLRARVLDAVLVCTLFLSKSISTTSVDTSVLTVRSWDR